MRRTPSLDISVRLQTTRKFKGLSRRELVKWTDVISSIISMVEKNSASPSISSPKKVLGGIPMSLVEFFSPNPEQDSHTQIVYKIDGLIDISSGAVSMCLVGKTYPSRVVAFFDETYPPGSDTGEEVLNHEGEKAGTLVDGRLELTVDSETCVFERGDSYYFESNRPHRFRNPYDVPACLISATTPADFRPKA